MSRAGRPPAVLAVIACLAFPAAVRAAHFDYLHVEAGTGAAGGGHAAIRFDDETYHFLHYDGLVRIVREPSEYFDYVYRALANRSIHATRVEVSDAGREALEDAFRRRHVVEDAQFEVLDDARRDADALEYLSAGRGRLMLRGAGYFAAAADVPARDGDLIGAAGRVALAAAADAVRAAYGDGYLEARAGRLDHDAAGVRYECRAAPVAMAHDRLPPPEYGFAARLADAWLGRIALDVLLGLRVAEPRAFVAFDDPVFAITPGEAAALHAYGKRLRASVVRLVSSQRRDWGFPVLVALARLVAVEATLHAGAFVLPDVHDADAESVPAGRVFADRRVAAALLADAGAQFAQARARVFSEEHAGEELWSRFELAANLLAELRRARRDGTQLRVLPDAPVPARSAALDRTLPLPRFSAGDAAQALQCAQAAKRAAREDLERLYHYEVIARNCVTEIFRTIDESGDDTVDARVDAGASFNFIPFVSASAVQAAYPVSARTTLPSYRRYWLERLRAEHGAFETAVRESNVLTSTLYRPRGDDVFLFFTDDARAMRPLYGAANVLVGAGSTAAGVLRLPFDRGRSLVAGARSLVFSIPELAFLNFRKGSNTVMPRDWTAPALRLD